MHLYFTYHNFFDQFGENQCFFLVKIHIIRLKYFNNFNFNILLSISVAKQL